MFSNRSSQLPEDLLAVLSARGTTQTFEKGELLIREGDEADALLVLLSGELKVFTQDDRGRELVYNLLQPGEFIGELMLDGGPRSASVRALSEATCVVLSAEEFHKLIREDPQFVECLVLKLISRVRHATEQLRNIAMKDVYERTTTLLNRLAVDDGEARYVDKLVTQQEIADRVGASREMISQVFRELIRGGFLVRDGKRRLLIAKPLPKHW